MLYDPEGRDIHMTLRVGTTTGPEGRDNCYKTPKFTQTLFYDMDYVRKLLAKLENLMGDYTRKLLARPLASSLGKSVLILQAIWGIRETYWPSLPWSPR